MLSFDAELIEGSDDDDDELSSRAKWIGICQSESSVNGFFPSNVSNSS